MKTLTWKIDGMRCDGCAKTIEARLLREPGVARAAVSHASGTARLLVDPEVASLEKVIALIVRAGYRVERSTDS